MDGRRRVGWSLWPPTQRTIQAVRRPWTIFHTPEIYPTRMRAIGTAAGTCWLRLASAAGPTVVAVTMRDYGIESVFVMFAAIAVIGAFAATRTIETRNRRLEEIAP